MGREGRMVPEHDGDGIVHETLVLIGRNIKDLRLRRGMSQEDLAAKAGVARTTVGNVESGRPVSSANLIELARALGVSAADFFITDEQREAVSYQTVKLLERLSEALSKK